MLTLFADHGLQHPRRFVLKRAIVLITTLHDRYTKHIINIKDSYVSVQGTSIGQSKCRQGMRPFGPLCWNIPGSGLDTT